MRRNGCRALLTVTFLTLAKEYKHVNEQKNKGEDYFLLALIKQKKSDSEAQVTIACAISTHCI